MTPEGEETLDRLTALLEKIYRTMTEQAQQIAVLQANQAVFEQGLIAQKEAIEKLATILEERAGMVRPRARAEKVLN